jgi:hypothetical protein
LYKACGLKTGSENSFERMWCIPNGFCKRPDCPVQVPH